MVKGRKKVKIVILTVFIFSIIMNNVHIKEVSILPARLNNAKQEILKVASKMLLEEDISKINMRKIALKSKIGLGTLYNYFPSKEELLEEVVRTEAKNVLEKVRVAVDKEVEIKDKMKIFYLIGKKNMREIDSIKIKNLISFFTECTETDNKVIVEKVNYFQAELIKFMMESLKLRNEIVARIFVNSLVWASGLEMADFEDVWEELRKLL